MKASHRRRPAGGGVVSTPSPRHAQCFEAACRIIRADALEKQPVRVIGTDAVPGPRPLIRRLRSTRGTRAVSARARAATGAHARAAADEAAATRAELAEALACLRDSKASVQALRREVAALKAQNAALQTAGAPRSSTAAAPEQQDATLVFEHGKVHVDERGCWLTFTGDHLPLVSSDLHAPGFVNASLAKDRSSVTVQLTEWSLEQRRFIERLVEHHRAA